MAVGIRRSALTLYKTENSKPITFKEEFEGFASRDFILKTMTLDGTTSRLIFHYGKDSKNRTRHFKKLDKDSPDEYDACEEIITLVIFPDSEAEKVEAEAKEYFKTRPEEGDYTVLPGVNQMMPVQQKLIEKYVPDWYIRINHGYSYDGIEEVFMIIGRILDNSEPHMSRVYQIIRERPGDLKSRIVEFIEKNDIILGSSSLLDY